MKGREKGNVDSKKSRDGQGPDGGQHPDVLKKLLKIFLERDMKSQQCPNMRSNGKLQGP